MYLVMEPEMSIEKAAESLNERLESHEWLTAVAVGELDFRDVIYVYVKSLRHKELDELKRNGWMGYEVVIEKIGTIHPAQC